MTDFYIRIPSDLSDYTCDQTIISKKKYLQHLSRVKYEEECSCPLPQIVDWYPFTNSYYPYTEDVDAVARVNHLLGSRPSFESLTSIENCDSFFDEDSYSEKGAQLQYLSLNPISFLILGKPGIGEQELAKLLADYWKCVYIDPETLIREEIDAGSRAGQCIEFNLRNGRAIGVDIILRLVEKRVKSKSAEHRGFVICGFPMIPNDLYEEDPISSESAVFNVQDIFEEIVETTVEIGVPPQIPNVSKASKLEEVPGEGGAESEVPPSRKTVKLPENQDDVPIDIGSATTSNICGPGDYEKNYEDQINFIFNLFHRPFIIIYVMCSNSDVVSKHKDYRFDFYSKQIVDLQREHSDKVVYTFFSRVPGATNDEIPDDFIDVVKNNTFVYDSSHARQLLQLPRDFPANMVTLLDRYRYFALPVLERHILVHDCQYFMKVDGRISPVRMFNAIRTRLRVLPIQKVVLPEKLVVPSEPGGEGGPEEMMDFEGLSFEECFQLFRKKRIPSTMFKWVWSEWGVKCPVSMREGDYKDGDPNFAVHFMNRIFFLSNEDAYLKFYRNPRPYLLPPFPKPSGRIFVLGPPCSGKSVVAKCLGYFLNTEVVDFHKLEKDFKTQQRLQYEETFRATAENEGIAALNQMRHHEWEEKEKERRLKEEEWVRQQQALLEETIKLKEYLAEDEDQISLIMELSSFPIQLSYHRKTRILKLHGSETSLASIDYVAKVKQTVEELEQLININGLPGLSDIALCEELLADRNKLLNYLPPKLMARDYDVEPASASDEFVKQYVEKAVSNMDYEDIELTPEQQVAIFSDAIEGIEERSLEQGNNKGGWIVDGIPIHMELFDKIVPHLLPDDIFILKDSDDHEFLLQRFETKGQNEFRDFRSFFMELGKPDAAWRSPSLRSTASYRSRAVGDILTDVLDESYFIAETKAAENNQAEKDPFFKKHPKKAAVENYKKELNEFDAKLENLYVILSNYKPTITEIRVTDKTFHTLLKEIVNNVENRFRQLASVFTEEDKLQEMEDFGEPEGQGEELGEGEEKAESEDLFFQNRRFGDTFNYCPVTFHNHWVLWRGKEEYAAKFKNKLYFMCNEDALNAFIYDPRSFLSQNEPPKSFPPPRICIVGPRGCGKTTIAEELCKNLGVYSVNYDKLIKLAIAPKSKFELLDILKMGIAGAQAAIIQNYLTTDEPLSEDFLNKVILPLWSQDPVKLFGFVLDGFPRRPSDVEYISEHATIPDVVVELSITDGEIQKRLLEIFINDFQIALTKKKDLVEKKRREIIDVWEEKRNTRFKELMELKKEERYAAKLLEKSQRTEDAENDEGARKSRYLEALAEAEEETEPSTARTKSLLSYDSVAEEADILAVNMVLEQEMPEIVFEEEPDESLEEAVERYANELQESYNEEIGFLRITRERCEAQLIPWFTVDAGMPADKVFAQVMRLVDKCKFRNDSLFERVYDISVDLADKLLSSGYYFLSKFGKTCPVQVYENINPIQMFLPMEQKFQLFPVIHRQYIYFLAGLENRNKFKENPLQYTSKKNYNFPLIPFKLAIVGPPKSGKTALAERFRRDLGMKVISRGQAGRYVLKYLEFSQLASNMESVLRLGWELTSEMEMKAVEAMAFDGKSITQGFVLDGFPCTVDEVRHLAQLGLVPHLVIYLKADQADIYEFLASDMGKRNLPVFSKKFVDHRYKEWLEMEDEFWEWLDKEYQIITKIPVKPSKWGVWTAAYELATAVFSEVKHYYKYARNDIALRLANMQITPLEFIERRSAYKSYCPGCLHYDNALVNGGDPPDRTGLVQFRKYYYYLCSEHIGEFIADPEQFISPYNNHELPPDLPVRVFLSQIPKHSYQEGVCIICYWENQPKRIIKKGNLNYALIYKESVYLFNSLSCMNKFMRHPHKYYAKTINFKGTPYPSLEYNQLPTLGLLEQYDARQLINAIMNAAVLRPIIPGLSTSISACINVGLYLKMHNPKTPKEFLPLYSTALNQFHERRANLINYLAEMKKMLNPYLYYDEPMPKFVDPLFSPSRITTLMGQESNFDVESEIEVGSTVSEITPENASVELPDDMLHFAPNNDV